MNLEIGKYYQFSCDNETIKARYEGINSNMRFQCAKCDKFRDNVHEFLANPDDYNNGYVGEWYHFGTECINNINLRIY